MKSRTVIPKTVERELCEHYGCWENFSAFVYFAVLLKCISNNQETANTLGYIVSYDDKTKVVHIQAPKGNHLYYEHKFGLIRSLNTLSAKEQIVFTVAIEPARENTIIAWQNRVVDDKAVDLVYTMEEPKQLEISNEIERQLKNHIANIVPNLETEMHGLHPEFED